MPPIRRMVVVANRLPVSRAARGGKSRWIVSPGGLVAALEPIVRERGGTWVGWTGTTGAIPRPFTSGGIGIRAVALSNREVETFYHGLSNRTLWPLYHDAIRAPEFHR